MQVLYFFPGGQCIGHIFIRIFVLKLKNCLAGKNNLCSFVKIEKN